MGKILIFALLWRLTGNPFIAILVLLVVIYLLDRRYVGLTPSFVKPFRRNRRLSRLRYELKHQPHHTSGKVEAARLLIEKKRYREALPYLEEARRVMDDSAEVLYDIGLCRLRLGDLAEGEALILEALEKSPRVRYGEPYLRLGEAFTQSDPEKAVHYLEEFRVLNTSSCEAYYRLGQLYADLGRKDDARSAFQEAVHIYQGLPKYKRRSERRWAILSMLKKNA